MLTVMSWNLQCLSHHLSMFCSRDMQILMLSNRVTTLMMVHTQVQNNRRHEANIFYGSPMYSVWINKSNKEWDLDDSVCNCDDNLCLYIFLYSSNVYNQESAFFTIYRYITNSQREQLPIGLVAQLVKHNHCTGIIICRGHGFESVQAWIFSDFHFHSY